MTSYYQPQITVAGIGGGGNNAIGRLPTDNPATYLALNTDVQALNGIHGVERIPLGLELTKGLGAGGNPQVGYNAAMRSKEHMQSAIKADLAIITAGLGGGTGTGGIPVLAEVCRAANALTMAIVTTPFAFEGRQRAAIAEQGLAALRQVVDTLIVVPNEKILSVIDRKTSINQAFQIADRILQHGIRAIANIITTHGIVNVDFNDLRATMTNAGSAIMGVGSGRGQARATDAMRHAIANPLMSGRIDGARNVMIHISGPEATTLHEINDAIGLISSSVDPDANIIFGFTPRETTDTVQITLIAANFTEQATQRTRNRPTQPMLRQPQVQKVLEPSPKRTATIDQNDLEIPTILRKTAVAQSENPC